MPGYFDHYTVTTTKGVAAATDSVQEAARALGFTVLGVHDLQAVFGRRGFHHGPVRVVELCNEEFGSHLLRVDPMMSLMMPCKIAVYAREGVTHISALRPRTLGDYFPQLAPLADHGDEVMCRIVDQAR